MPSIAQLEAERTQLGLDIVARYAALETELPAAPTEAAAEELAAELNEMEARFRLLDYTVRTASAALVYHYDASTLGLDPTVGTLPWTFTRASAGSRINAAGLYEEVAANTPRFSYDPVTLALRGWVLEAVYINRNIRSDAFDNAAWTKVDTTITANNTAGPDGNVVADLVTEGSAGTAELTRATSTIVAGRSVHQARNIKRGNHDWVMLEASSDAGANGVRTWFNVATGEVGQSQAFGNGAFVGAYVFPRANGFFRCYHIMTVDAAATSVSNKSQSASADGSTTRVNGATRYEWQAFLSDPSNRRKTPRRGISTAGAQVTVASELPSVSIDGAPGFDRKSFTLFYDGWVPLPNKTSELPRFIEVDNNVSIDSGAWLEQSNIEGFPEILAGVIAEVYSEATQLFYGRVDLVPLNSRFRAALSVTESSRAMAVNGVAPLPGNVVEVAPGAPREITHIRPTFIGQSGIACNEGLNWMVFSPALSQEAINVLTEAP